MISNVSLPWWAWAAMGVGLVAFIGMIALTVKRNRGMHRSLFASPYTLWMIIFTVVPVILISYYAFTDANGAFTLDNFKNFWDSHYEANKVIREHEDELRAVAEFQSGDFSYLIEKGELSEDGQTLALPIAAITNEDASLMFLKTRGSVSLDGATLTIPVARLHEKVDYSQYIERGTVNWDTLVYSLWMAFQCTIICLLLGYPAALFMADRKVKLGATLVVLFIIPMWMNFLLRTVAWMSLLEDSGLINSLLRSLGFEGVQMMYTSNTVLLGMVYNYLPFMVFPIYTVLNKMDYRLSEAAADLGCNSFQTLYKVTVPLSVPGIVSGITMVFMPSVTTFFIPRVLGGGYTMMFGDLIESKFLTEGNWNAGSALSLLMMLLILVSLSILRKVDPNGEGGGLA